MLVFLLKIIEKCEIVLSRPTEYFRIRRLYYHGRQSTSALRDCTISADGVLLALCDCTTCYGVEHSHSEIALLRPKQYFRILRLHYFGPHSTSALRECTTTADRVLPRSEIALQRPTEYFRVRRLYYHGRQSTSAFRECTMISKSAAKLLTLRNISKSKSHFLFFQHKFAVFSLNYRH